MSSIRQRKPLVVPEAHPVFDAPVFRQFKKLDIYPKPVSETVRTTASGGCVSLVASVFILGLIASELRAYLSGSEAYHDRLMVDYGVNDRVPINFNITFPHLQCQGVNLDVMDAAGAQQNNVHTDMYKSPVDAAGELVFRGYYNYVPHFNGEYDPKNDPLSPQFCGKCYIKPRGQKHGLNREGGVVDTHLTGHHAGECCNSCQQVMQMYDIHRLARPPLNEVEQCLHELFQQNPGCNVQGTVYVQKVRGNIHFAPGASVEIGHSHAGGAHVHTFDRMQALGWNNSHRIHHFSIGAHNVTRFSKRGVVFPLDGASLNLRDGTALIKYFIKVVPTAYQPASRPMQSSYEFSVTRHYREYHANTRQAFLPGLFFVFDFHPIKIVHTYQRPPIAHFLVKVAGLVGGLFVVSSMLDKALHFALHVRRGFRPTPVPPSL